VVICSRCRSPVRGFSRIEATGGPIRSCIHGPLELCPKCVDGFLEWLRSGHQANHGGPGGALGDTAVAAMAMTWASV